MILKYNIVVLKYISLILILLTFSIPANSEMSVEETIKGRKAIFSKEFKYCGVSCGPHYRHENIIQLLYVSEIYDNESNKKSFDQEGKNTT